MSRLYAREDSPYWYAEIDLGGYTKRVSTGIPRSPKTRKDAEAVAEQKQHELKDKVKRTNTPDLLSVAIAFLNKGNGQCESTLDHYSYHLAPIIEAMGNPLISDITVPAFRDYVALRRSQVGDTRARREILILRSVLNFAADRRFPGTPEINPCQVISFRGFDLPKPQKRYLDREQVAAILQQISSKPFWVAFVGLILETGMRREEVLGLPWSEVDLDQGFIQLGAEREKTKRGRIIPLTDHAKDILERLPRLSTCPHVFFNPKTRERYKSINREWNRLRRSAGVPHARIHDLRHTFATYTRESGMSREDRMAIMGHSSQDSHAHYAVGTVEGMKKELNRHRPLNLLPSAD
jgi:integrase